MFLAGGLPRRLDRAILAPLAWTQCSRLRTKEAEHVGGLQRCPRETRADLSDRFATREKHCCANGSGRVIAPVFGHIGNGLPRARLRVVQRGGCLGCNQLVDRTYFSAGEEHEPTGQYRRCICGRYKTYRCWNLKAVLVSGRTVVRFSERGR